MIYVIFQFMLIAILIISANFANIYFGYILFIISAIFGLIALKNMQMQNLNVVPELRNNHIFISNGIYKYIRHPMYLSIFVLTLPLVFSNLNIFSIIIYLLLLTTLYFKSKLEEKYLCERFKEYENYQKTVGRFLPKIIK
jgi:protein-S-isoprenylcysteine O-methyltransferase Ste14